jgi:hypothetical protein
VRRRKILHERKDIARPARSLGVALLVSAGPPHSIEPTALGSVLRDNRAAQIARLIEDKAKAQVRANLRCLSTSAYGAGRILEAGPGA